MTTGRPIEHVKELTGLLHRLMRRIEQRKAVGEPVHLEERQVSAIRWVVAEAARAGELRRELQRATAALRESDEDQNAEAGR